MVKFLFFAERMSESCQKNMTPNHQHTNYHHGVLDPILKEMVIISNLRSVK
jgi:hypothetical protein